MIEAYAFLAMFTMQLLTLSVLYPIWFGRLVRTMAAGFPAARFSQLYPGVDHERILRRYLMLYRVASACIVVIGLALLGWLFNYLQRPDWDDGPVEARVGGYFLLQGLPMIVAAVLAVKYNALLERLLEKKRSATLQRRGLFDYVSPFAVTLAALSYLGYVAYVLYIARDPFPGFAGPVVNIVAMTLVFAVQALAVYYLLYRKRVDPHETNAARAHTTGVGVRGCVYLCIASTVNLSASFTLIRLDMQRWEPFAQSAFFVFIALLAFKATTAPPRRPEAGELGSGAVT